MENVAHQTISYVKCNIIYFPDIPEWYYTLISISLFSCHQPDLPFHVLCSEENKKSDDCDDDDGDDELASS